MLFFGCLHSEAIALNDHLSIDRNGKTKAAKYLHQRHSAAKRGIEWHMTFAEWVSVWVSSGKWDQRGRGKGCYCMARHGDAGPYKIGNVSIQLIETNSRDGIKITHASARRHGTHRHRLGVGKGWAYVARMKNRPYQVYMSKTYIGNFSTQEEAEAAYRAACELEFARHASIVFPAPEFDMAIGGNTK